MNSASGRLRLFVYGTLQRGQVNHARYCGGAAAITPARVRGRLYHLTLGYPILVIPDGDVLAVGTSDPVADLATQQIATGALPQPLADRHHEPWLLVEGEIIEFDDAAERLPPIDALEDFFPGRDEIYRRVLVKTAEPAGMIVWTYIAPDGRLPAGAVSSGERWP
ncbi:MAG: gamma-glutamylcyclotransferase [Planctomycetia bacterium]|nr:gamma-glutamylcyclotransferase [Planctomycetia bacterium]